MGIKAMKPKRCNKEGCRKIICSKNKSGYCSSCGVRIRAIKRKRSFCGICEEPCSGKMLIEHYKGRYVSLCTYHFNRLIFINDQKDLRAMIKRLRGCH